MKSTKLPEENEKSVDYLVLEKPGETLTLTMFLLPVMLRELESKKMAYYETGIIGIGDKTGGDYTDTILWGKQGGRPRKWANEAERKRTQRAQAKLEQGQPLTQPEKELLGLIKRRPGALKHPELGRPLTPAERQRARRAKLKAEQAELAWLEEGL